MNKLLDDLIRYKDSCTDKIKLETKSLPLSFSDLYIRFHEALDEVNAMVSRGMNVTQKKVEFYKLENEVDSCWNALSEAQRKEAIDELITRDVLPQKINDVLQNFGGKVVDIT